MKVLYPCGRAPLKTPTPSGGSPHTMLLCQNTIGTLTIEWHSPSPAYHWTPEQLLRFHEIENLSKNHLCKSSTQTTLQEIDDESYLGFADNVEAKGLRQCLQGLNEALHTIVTHILWSRHPLLFSPQPLWAGGIGCPSPMACAFSLSLVKIKLG